MRSCLPGLLACLVLPAVALAQDGNDPVFDAWLKFQKTHAGSWTAEWSPATGTPHAIYGQGTRVFDGPLESFEQARALTAGLLKKYTNVLGLGESTLVESTSGQANNVYVFVYDQYYKGLPVIDGRADLRIHTNGVLSMLGSEALQFPKGFNVTPKLQQKHVWPLAHRYVNQEDLLQKKPAPAQGDARLVIWGDLKAKKKATPILAWQVQIDTGANNGLPFLGKVFVNANTGAFLEFRNEIYECSLGCTHVARQGARERKVDARPSLAELKEMGDALRKPRKAMPKKPMVNLVGTVKAWVNNNHTKAKTLTNLTMPNLRLTVQGSSTTYYTDSKGNFNISWSGTSNVNVTAHLDGRHLKSQTSLISPATITVTKSVKPGTSTTLQFLASNALDHQYARTTTYWMTDDVMVWVRTMLKSSTALDTLSKITARINVNASCNATYGGNNMNFYRKSSTCYNTAFGTVIYHEWGHGLDDRHGGIIRTEGMSEGWADMIAIMRSKQPVVGAGFRLNGTAVRTALNTKTWPPSGGVHSMGEVWMGWGWDFRTNMVKKYNTTVGHAFTEQRIVPTIIANASNQTNGVREVFLADDNDGNLNNGTPHYDQLAAASTKRKIKFPVRKAGEVLHSPIASAKVDQLAAQCVKAQVKLLFGTLTKIEVVYKIDNGSTLRRPMIKRGTDYVALLPGILAGKMSYRIEAVHSTSEQFRNPASGDYSYLVGKEVVFFDDFEGKDKGWTHAKVTKEDDWQLGTPAGKTGTSGGKAWKDPSKALSGTKCWANDLGQGSSNGSYTNNMENYLRSPTLNLTGKSGVTLRFGRWLGVEGFFDAATVQVNGTNVWGNGNTEILDTGWTTQAIDINAQAANKSSVQLEWRLKSDDFTEYGGWAIDNIEVLANKSTKLPLEFRQVPAQVGLGKKTVGSLKGSPNASVVVGWSLNEGTTTVPGIPTLKLGAPVTVILFTKLDSSGNWSQTSTVPTLTSIIGTLAFMQAVVDDKGKIDVSNPQKLLITK